jgi:hypothetical protein
VSAAIALLTAALTLAPAARAEGPELSRRLPESGSERYYVDVEVHLPNPLMLYRELNRQARLVAYQAELVLDCAVVESSRRGWEVACRIEDISIVGATTLGDVGRMGEVLDEVDERLTGAVLQLDWRRDGRIANIDLEGLDRRNRRLSQNAETLRLMLARAVAGFDLQLPRGGAAEDGVWGQMGGLLLAAPYRRGSQGSGEMVHRVRRAEAEAVVIETAGRGIVAPATDGATGPANLYDTALESVTRFDTVNGRIAQRRWTAVGTPTAGSAVTDGAAGVDYLQAGQITALGPEDPAPVLRPTGEASAPGAAPSAIQQWTPIPALPGAQ